MRREAGTGSGTADNRIPCAGLHGFSQGNQSVGLPRLQVWHVTERQLSVFSHEARVQVAEVAGQGVCNVPANRGSFRASQSVSPRRTLPSRPCRASSWDSSFGNSVRALPVCDVSDASVRNRSDFVESRSTITSSPVRQLPVSYQRVHRSCGRARQGRSLLLHG